MPGEQTEYQDDRRDVARRLHVTVRERLLVALSDLFTPTRLRLTERNRTIMVSLLARMIRSIEDELRTRLIDRFPESDYPALHAALGSWHVEIALPILESSPALRDPELVSFLLRRVEEHRLHATRGPRFGDRERRLLNDLARDTDAGVAEAAMAVLISLSARLDRFEEPAIVGTDLPAELEHGLVWVIAAALRTYLIERHEIDPMVADDEVSKAAAARLWEYDESDGLDARCMKLVRRVHELGRLDPEFMVRTLTETGLPLFLAAIAHSCRLTFEAAWEILSDPDRKGPPILLRTAGFDRDNAGAILACLVAGLEDEDMLLIRQMEIFDSVAPPQAKNALRLWQVDPAYRAAIARVTTRASELFVN